MWGHGFVARYYAAQPTAVRLRRYRCPSCKTVVTLRPKDFWPRFQTTISSIYEALRHRLVKHTWPPALARQRAGHWLRRFMAKARMDFADADPTPLLTWLYQNGIHFLH